MGLSWSNPRRRSYPYPYPPPPPPPHHSYYYSADHPHHPPPAPPNGYFSAPPYPPPHHHPPYPAYPPPVPSYGGPVSYSSYSYSGPVAGRVGPHPYYANQASGWPPARPAMAAAAAAPPTAYVEQHQNAKKVRNVVNVHKDTIRVEIDEHDPDCHLVSFLFDALHDGSITILYFGKEESNCRLVPLFPEAFGPAKFQFQKGLGQKFCQPSGTGIDLGFFELDDLSKPSPGEDVFPLVISAETCVLPHSVDDHLVNPVPCASSHTQITQAVLEKNNGGPFHVKVVKQILWVDGVRYELRELYGLGSSSAESYNDNDPGKECVICMTEPKDTAILPCRHLCMCNECARALTHQSNKCPICRQPIEELIEIKISN
ncbi:probable E3 ubiquitin-protein ligase LUL4 [Rhodamnia argentea]|uniref:RING-type E3 ubiquitin transferase n=1 Tax=Rhodamnia argentea TaxID=178133 RepID=A0A8B8QLZ9_9MYRT|nr:probable E3 ubiquitin-protein ligase LUL4 [Rhodamnia argentea]